MKRFHFVSVLLLALALAAPQSDTGGEEQAAPELRYSLPVMLAPEIQRSCREIAMDRYHQFRQADLISEGRYDLVYVGDSLVQGWAPLPDLRQVKAANRGISCDTTRGLHERLLRDVAQYRPRAAVVLIGTNDLAMLTRLPPRDRALHVTTNISSLALRLKGHGVTPVILGLFPTRLAYPNLSVSSTNELIRDINEELGRFCRRMGFPFLNVAGELSDDLRQLKAEFTNDGLHLNAAGYNHLNRLITGHLRKFL